MRDPGLNGADKSWNDPSVASHSIFLKKIDRNFKVGQEQAVTARQVK